MAINQNHLFEDLDGIKCAIVEKDAGPSRVEFLRQVLTYNQYQVIVVPSPPAKALQAAAITSAASTPGENDPVAAVTPETFTVGVTDLTFNPTNAIFGRSLKLPGNRVVTRAFWLQQESVSQDDRPYFDSRNPAV